MKTSGKRKRCDLAISGRKKPTVSTDSRILLGLLGKKSEQG
jgi:hypothetical protein